MTDTIVEVNPASTSVAVDDNTIVTIESRQIDVVTAGTQGPQGPQGQTGATGPAGPNTVSGLITAGANINISGLGTSASPYQLSTTGGTPGGADTQIQYNNAGGFGASSRLTFDNTGVTVTGATSSSETYLTLRRANLGTLFSFQSSGSTQSLLQMGSLSRLETNATGGEFRLGNLNGRTAIAINGVSGEQRVGIGFQNHTPQATLHVLNTTATTGTTNVFIDAGAGQSGNLTSWRDNAGTVGASVTASMEFSNSSGVSGAERFGAGAAATGTSSTALGNGASAAGSSSTAIGNAASVGSAHTGSISLGINAISTGSQQFVVGRPSGSGIVRTMYLGGVVGTNPPASVTYTTTSGSGTNIAGSTLYIAPGASTGNATPARVIIQSTAAGASGSAAQAMADEVTVTRGLVTFAGAAVVADDPYSASWNGSTQVPTKNAIYDKIETMGGGVSESFAIAMAVAL